VRGAVADPERIVICDGFTQGLTLVCRALHARGARRIAVEDPCCRAHREIIRHNGLEAVPVAVDEDGIRVEELARHSVSAVVVSPAHQFPTGYLLSPQRRAQLLEWASRTGALVIEYDYDAQYRYDGPPVGALQGLAPATVVYAGTASKILAPGLRVGWLVVPAAMTDAVIRHKVCDDLGSNLPTQLTLARFIERGDLDRHLRRLRRSYRARRDALITALRRHLPGARVQGIAAGLHALALLPEQMNEARLCEQARGRGVSVYGLGRYRANPRSGAPGLVLGYASLAEAKIKRGIQELAQACPSPA
jgi:GntR family transcriptional regulator/MocR family aminotransferase